MLTSSGLKTVLNIGVFLILYKVRLDAGSIKNPKDTVNPSSYHLMEVNGFCFTQALAPESENNQITYVNVTDFLSWPLCSPA